MERLKELKKILAEDCPGLELRADEPSEGIVVIYGLSFYGL